MQADNCEWVLIQPPRKLEASATQALFKCLRSKKHVFKTTGWRGYSKPSQLRNPIFPIKICTAVLSFTPLLRRVISVLDEESLLYCTIRPGIGNISLIVSFIQTTGPHLPKRVFQRFHLLATSHRIVIVRDNIFLELQFFTDNFSVTPRRLSPP
jgi:hypothetical protein